MNRPKRPYAYNRPPVNPNNPHDHCWDMFGDWSFVISNGYINHSIYLMPVDPNRVNWGDELHETAGRPALVHLVRLDRVNDGYEYWMRKNHNPRILDILGGVEYVEQGRYNTCVWISDGSLERIKTFFQVTAKLAEPLEMA